MLSVYFNKLSFLCIKIDSFDWKSKKNSLDIRLKNISHTEATMRWLNDVISSHAKFIFLQRFIQHFELLQKACIPDNISYPSFMESTSCARFSVSSR